MRKKDLYLDYEAGKIYWLYYDTGDMKEVGWTHSQGYLCFDLKGKKLRIHRFLYQQFHKEKLQPHNQIDHINRDKKDNRISNLRIVSNIQNSQNTKCHKDNKLGHKNINYDKRRKTYNVRIQVVGKQNHIGVYKTLEEAIIARDNKIKELNSQGHIFST